eukprot:m.280697 g.280697  ORF g.280697 m.280697 type:complete len:236 (+) comp17736_c0_seq18:441-1148(+)
MMAMTTTTTWQRKPKNGLLSPPRSSIGTVLETLPSAILDLHLGLSQCPKTLVCSAVSAADMGYHVVNRLGPLAMDTAKKVIQRQAPRKTEALGVVMRPDTSDKVQDDKDPTTARVEMVMNKLDEHLEELDETDCCFFKFAFNPKSFSQTVENIFYISFLVKDNYVAVSYDDEGLPRLGFGSRAIESADGDEATAEQGGVKRQMMFNINHSLWNDIVKAFNITDCILPHRKSTLKE